LGGLGEALELVPEPIERAALELADALAREAELLADRLERGRLAVEAVAELEDPPLPVRELRDCLPDDVVPVRVRRLLGRVGRGRVAEEVAQLTVLARADRLVQRDRRVGGVERLVDVLERQARRLRQLLPRRLAGEPWLALAGG